MQEEDFYKLSVAAARQQGMITAAQVNKLDIEVSALQEFIAVGLLSELDWSVYQLVGSSLGPRYAYPYAAWLALRSELFSWERPEGPGDAVVSHESAAALHGLGSLSAPLMVFTAGAECIAPRATKVHVSRLSEKDTTACMGVPVTTPHRTLLDLVRGWTGHADLQRAVTDAVRRDLVDLWALYEEMIPLAEEHDFPVDGPEFVGYFMPVLQPNNLSPRNLRAYAALVSAERVAQILPRVTQLLAEARIAFGSHPADKAGDDAKVSQDLAAEIVGHIAWDR